MELYSHLDLFGSHSVAGKIFPCLVVEKSVGKDDDKWKGKGNWCNLSTELK